MDAAPAAPVAGWYPDPAGSGGRRWWDGAGWTESVRMPAPPAPTEPVRPASAAAPDYAGDPRFGPVDPAAVARTAQESAGALPGGVGAAGFGAVGGGHRAGPVRPARSSGPLDRRLLAAVGAVVLLVVAVLVGKSVLGGSGSAPGASPGLSGLIAPGNPQVAAMRADVLSIADAEESTFTESQTYVAGGGAGGSLLVGTVPVRLSAPGERVTVVLSPTHLAYCIRAARTPAGGGSPQVVVYVSSTGGMQPSIVSSCPASF